MQQFSLAARLYIWFVCFLGAASFACALVLFPPPLHKWPLFLVGTILSVAAGMRKMLLFAVRRRDSESPTRATMSLGFIPSYLLLLAIGPFAGVMVSSLNALVSSLYPRRAHGYQIPFSISAVAFSAFSSGLVLHSFGFYNEHRNVWELFGPNTQAALSRLLISVTLSALTYWMVNTTLVALAIALTSGQKSV